MDLYDFFIFMAFSLAQCQPISNKTLKDMSVKPTSTKALQNTIRHKVFTNFICSVQ